MERMTKRMLEAKEKYGQAVQRMYDEYGAANRNHLWDDNRRSIHNDIIHWDTEYLIALDDMLAGKDTDFVEQTTTV